MTALTYADSVWWTFMGAAGVFLALVLIGLLVSSREFRIAVALALSFAAFVAGVGAIVWWIS